MHDQSTTAAPVPQLRLIALDRAVIEEMAQARIDEAHALLALLDRFDGDPDCEEDDAPEDDDPAGQCDEDGTNTGGGEAWLHAMQDAGPGCSISDPGERDEGAYQHGA